MEENEAPLEILVEADVQLNKCNDGHFFCMVSFKIKGKVVYRSSRSPCFDSEKEAVAAANGFCIQMAPIVLEGYVNKGLAPTVPANDTLH